MDAEQAHCALQVAIRLLTDPLDLDLEIQSEPRAIRGKYGSSQPLRERQARLDAGELPDFLPETKTIRDSDWTVNKITNPDLQKRWVELTGPTDRNLHPPAYNHLPSGSNKSSMSRQPDPVPQRLFRCRGAG